MAVLGRGLGSYIRTSTWLENVECRKLLGAFSHELPSRPDSVYEVAVKRNFDVVATRHLLSDACFLFNDTLLVRAMQS